MLIEIWQVFYHPSKKGSEIVCLKLIMISWHTLLTGVTCMLLNSSRSDKVYGKLCEIKSAIGLRFYEANHAFLAEFSKSVLNPPPPRPHFIVATLRKQRVFGGWNFDCLWSYGALWRKMGWKDQCSRQLELTVKNSERIEAKDSLCPFRLETVKCKMSPQQLFCNNSWMPKENGSIWWIGLKKCFIM